MVEPALSDPDALNEKHTPSTDTSTALPTTLADSRELREKDFAYPTSKSEKDGQVFYASTSPAASAFDLDLEAGLHSPPNTTFNSHLHIPRTNTHHSNASSPADIGYPSRRNRNAELDPGPGEVDIGRVGMPMDGVRGRPRRRVRRNHASFAAFPPTVRRAHSLPSHPPVTMLSGPGVQPSMVKTLNTLLVPEKKLAPPPGWKDSVMNTITYSNMNWFLIFVPIAWGMKYGGASDTLTFVFAFLAIIPLAALLCFATEELALKVGPTLGGLLNATFGNAVELIISILALVKGELRVVQAAMLGSILSNCLLVLGMCFLAGGFRFHEQGYGVRAAQLNISLLSISVFSIVIPAAFNSSINFANSNVQQTESQQIATDRSVLAISRGTSIILLFVYAAYLVFQLWTHAYIYSPEASAYHSAQTHQHAGGDGPSAPQGQRVFRIPHLPSLPSLPSIITHHHTDTTTHSRSSSRGSTHTSRSSSTSSSSSSSSSSTEDVETQKLKTVAALALLVLVTVITGLTAEFLVGSINGLTATGKISKEFVALILLPLVGNAAEHVTAVTVSVKNKLDLAITVAVGSSIQIALFVIPFLVLLGWIIHQPLSLFFDIYETVVVFVSILVVNYAISDGRTNWLEGLVLMVIYVLIALTTWYYPGSLS